MFNFRKKQQLGEEITLKIAGMHCAACSLNIDDALEEIPGVYESDTHYARAITKVSVDPQIVKLEQLVKAIEGLGYTVSSYGAN